MSHVSFPTESPQLAAIEKRLPTASLSQVLDSMDELTDLSQKTGEVAQTVFSSGLFEAAMKRSVELNDREMAINHQICHWREELNDLSISKDRLTPDDIAFKLNDLKEKIFSCPEPESPMMRAQLNAIKRAWNHLYFLDQFPVAEELNFSFFQNNLSHQMKHSPDGKKHAQSLKQLCHAAEEAFGGRVSAFQRLPDEDRQATEQCLFRTFSKKMLLKDCDPTILASAIMSVVSDRLIF